MQSVNPWTALFSAIGGQLGVLNIEKEVLSDVGTYRSNRSAASAMH